MPYASNLKPPTGPLGPRYELRAMSSSLSALCPLFYALFLRPITVPPGPRLAPCALGLQPPISDEPHAPSLELTRL